jgi:hypothetical protein
MIWGNNIDFNIDSTIVLKKVSLYIVHAVLSQGSGEKKNTFFKIGFGPFVTLSLARTVDIYNTSN